MSTWTKLFDLTGKTAIVTGASYGLGATFAEVLADAGAKVVLAARSMDKLQRVAERIALAQGLALPVVCDVGDAEQVARMVATAKEQLGRVDILVNNAGVAVDAGAMPEMLPHHLFEETVRINLLGVWYCCREAGACMLRDGGGSIINISSIAGLGGWRDLAPAYQATKAAIINLTRNLACSWADRGVRVNAIAPGWFPSEMTGSFLGIGSIHKQVADAAPMGRIGDPNELAGPLLFLASQASSFVTGHTLVVDGGVSARGGQFSFPEDAYTILEKAMPHGTGRRIKPD